MGTLFSKNDKNISEDNKDAVVVNTSNLPFYQFDEDFNNLRNIIVNILESIRDNTSVGITVEQFKKTLLQMLINIKKYLDKNYHDVIIPFNEERVDEVIIKLTAVYEDVSGINIDEYRENIRTIINTELDTTTTTSKQLEKLITKAEMADRQSQLLMVAIPLLVLISEASYYDTERTMNLFSGRGGAKKLTGRRHRQSGRRQRRSATKKNGRRNRSRS